MGNTPQIPQTGQDFTPVKLKDGTTLKLKGTGLTPEQVASGVAKFKALKPPVQPPAAPSQGQLQGQTPPPSSTSNPVPEYKGGYAGFTPGHMASAVGQGLKNIVSQAGSGPKGEGGIVEIAASPEKYLPIFSEQQNEIRDQAKTAFKRGGVSGDTEGMTKALFAIIPMVGPWLNDKYNQAMSGDVGGSVVETATTAAAAKIVEHLQGKGVHTAEDLKNAFPKHAIVAAANDTLESSAKEMKQNMGTSFKVAKENGVAKLAQNISIADKLDSKAKGVPGSFSSANINTLIDQTVKDKGAGNSFAKATVDMSGTKIIKAALAKKGPFLSWDDVKDVRSAIDSARQVAGGKDAAVVGDLYHKFTSVMKQRAFQLGKVDEFNDYTTTTKALSDHQNGVIKKLAAADTGLKFFNELAKQSNRPQLDDLFNLLEKHGGMPQNYINDILKDHSKIARLASLAEGTTYTGERGGRLGSVMRHPVAAGSAMAATAAGASGAPLGVRFILSLGAAMKADDIMNRYEAAKQIRELGGPSNVTGRYGTPAGSPTPFGGGPQSSAGPGLPQGPGGVGGPGGLPQAPSPVPQGLSPALAKLLPQVASKAKIETDSVGVKWATSPEGIKISIPKSISEDKIQKYAEAKIQEQTKAQEEIKAKVSKVIEGQHGVEPSKRTGMMKDTVEARKAKAAERVSAQRAEIGRTQQKASLDEQARSLAGKVTPQSLKSVSIVDIEEAAKELDHTPNKMIYKGLMKLRKSQNWSEDEYRGYMEDFILKSIDMKSGKGN